MIGDLESVVAELRACRACAAHLPLAPRPVFQVSTTARLLITSQAPGTRAHETGMPFNDASGDRLRAWLGLSREVFYDAARVAIFPVGLCYPGRLPQGGDEPPRPECAPRWRPRVVPLLAGVRLTLLVGGYAQALVLGAGPMGERVRRFREFLPTYFPLPHPSWRTTAWERKNAWFGEELLPVLRGMVGGLVGNP